MGAAYAGAVTVAEPTAVATVMAAMAASTDLREVYSGNVGPPVRSFSETLDEWGGEPVGQDAVPVTELPYFVTWYVTMAPLQKWNFSVTGALSCSAFRKSDVRVILPPA